MSDSLNPPFIRTAGIRMIAVANGKYKVWTKTVGSGKTKVLLLHGGPGFSHDYFECFEDFLPAAGFEIIYYDQLGCSNSDVPDDNSLWTLPRYVDEVHEVTQALDLEEFVILGHSWGGILAIEYTLKYQDEGRLRGIIVSNMVASTDSFLLYAKQWKSTLSTDLQAACEKIEAEEDWENPLYEDIMMNHLYPKMICRIQPWPEPLTRAIRLANLKIYHFMQGHSEFVVTGNLKGWSSWDRLHKIRVKTLMLGAEHDEMNPEDMKRMAEIVPNGSAAICSEGSHMAFWDSQEIYFEYLVQFLRSL